MRACETARRVKVGLLHTADRSAFASNQAVETVRSGAESGNEKEEETVDDSQLAFVLDGPEAVRPVHLEVGNRHLAAGKKGSNAGEKSHLRSTGCSQA